MESDEKLRRMIRDLGRTLAEAISDSSEASQTLRRLQEEGYAISLELGRASNGTPQETLTVTLERRARESARTRPGLPGPLGSDEPEFRIHSRDLQFLRSVGIDPTRRSRRRR